MSKVRLRITMSLDGFVAGPGQSVREPLGAGGESLHEWMFVTDVWHRMIGKPGGERNESSLLFEEWTANVGATIMGRNMFGGHPGPWDPAKPWTGWWGKNPPYHHDVFVLTHHAREPLVMEGGTTFHFVTTGIEDALARARRAAGVKDVGVAGGAKAAQQYLAAGVVDDMEVSVSPVLLGAGERLFDGVSDLHGLALVRTVPMRNVVHLKFARP